MRAAWTVLFVVMALISYMAIEPLWVRRTLVTVTDSDIPASFTGYTIAFISDIHYGKYLGAARLKGVVSRINALHPDLVILGGDYISDSARFIRPCFDILKDLKAKDGVCCVLGNHDHWVAPGLVRDSIRRAGFTSINNRSFWLQRGDDRILVGGVGDLWEDGQMTDAVLGDANAADFCLVASHNPDYYTGVDKRIDLMLAGHTHGGQVTLFGLWAPLLPIRNRQYRYGLHGSGGNQLYVTSGVGTVTPPLRFFCRPEIAIIRLHGLARGG